MAGGDPEGNDDDPDNATMCTNIEIRLHRFIVDNGLRGTFVNTEIALRIYLCLMVTNCSVWTIVLEVEADKELFKVHDVARAPIDALSLLSIEHELLREIDSQAIIRDFASMHARRVTVWTSRFKKIKTVYCICTLFAVLGGCRVWLLV